MRTAVCLVLALFVVVAAGWQIGDTARYLLGEHGVWAALPVSIGVGAATGRAFGRLARTPELD